MEVLSSSETSPQSISQNDITDIPMKPKMSEIIRPKKIDIEKFQKLKNALTKPIEGLTQIPDLTIPLEMQSDKKKRIANDDLPTKIRELLNKVTDGNLGEIQEDLRTSLSSYTIDLQKIDEIAQIFISKIILDSRGINNYLELLNCICTMCIVLDKKVDDSGKSVVVYSTTIGNSFLKKCRSQLFNSIKLVTIRDLVVHGISDGREDQDIYNRERTYIFNLVKTICQLYERRPKVKKDEYTINLNIQHLYVTINIIINQFIHVNKIYLLYKKIIDLSVPFEDDMSDPLYELFQKVLYDADLYMRIEEFYADIIFVFMERSKIYKADTSIYQDDNSSNYKPKNVKFVTDDPVNEDDINNNSEDNVILKYYCMCLKKELEDKIPEIDLSIPEYQSDILNKVKDRTMKDVVDRFEKEVIPTMTSKRLKMIYSAEK